MGFEKSKLSCFRKWKEYIFRLNRLHPMISELKLQILQLQSELELLQSMNSHQALPSNSSSSSSSSSSSRKDPNDERNTETNAVGPSLLAAERALNK
jgi:hypothetical protein